MSKLKIGVLGAQRGKIMIRFMMEYPDVQLVAVCDKFEPALDQCREEAEKHGIKIHLFQDFDQFLNCDMDAVILANYATEHVPFALKCLKSGRHVMSEVMVCQTLDEAVQLVEAVEKSGKTYAYAENYCYLRSVMEMKKRYRRGDIGEFIHGEGEYVHDGTASWPQLTYGDSNHWRNRAYASFYLSHSLGPIISITGTKPKTIVGFENQISEPLHDLGSSSATAAMVMIQMDNGATVKALKGHMKRNEISVWYNLYGTKGCMESDRFGKRTYALNVYQEGEKAGEGSFEQYEPERLVDTPFARSFESPSGHSGSDFYTSYHFVEKLLGRSDGRELIDVYQAMDMSLPGILAYHSTLSGGIPVEYRDLRDPSNREYYRNDTRCTDPNVAREGQLLPANSYHRAPISKEGYDKVKELWKSTL